MSGRLKSYFLVVFGSKILLVFLALFLFNTSVIAHEVTLQWDANSEPDLDHYVVHWGLDPGAYSYNSGNIGLVTSYSCTIPDDGKIYYFSVTAVDNTGLSSDYSNVVNTGNVLSDSAPVANAGPDQNVNEGSVVYLDGSNSNDADGGPLSYQWKQVSGLSVTLDDTKAVQPIFDSPYINSEGESLTFELTVTNQNGLQSMDSCVVNIVSLNNPPVANAGPDQNVKEGMEVILNGTNSSDPDGDSLFYQWRQVTGSSVTLNDETAAKPVFDSPYIDSKGESLKFELIVTDQNGLQSTDSCIINIVSENNPPVANAGPDLNSDEGLMVYLNGTGSSDPDGDSLSYQWTQTGGSSVTLTDPSSAIAEFEAFFVDPQGESLTFQLTVTDPDGLESTDTCIVNILWVNNPPVADAGPDQEVDGVSAVYLNGSASSDPDGDTLTYQWIQTGGTPVTLNDPNGRQPSFSYPQNSPSGEALTFQLTVTDDGGLKSTDQCSVVTAPSHYDITGNWSSLSPIERNKKSWISGGFNVTNFGNQINRTFNVSFYLSGNSSYDSSDTPVYSQALSTLGEYETVNIALNNIKVEGDVIGKYIICIVDNDNQIAEDDESNNTSFYLLR